MGRFQSIVGLWRSGDGLCVEISSIAAAAGGAMRSDATGMLATPASFLPPREPVAFGTWPGRGCKCARCGAWIDLRKTAECRS